MRYALACLVFGRWSETIATANGRVPTSPCHLIKLQLATTTTTKSLRHLDDLCGDTDIRQVQLCLAWQRNEGIGWWRVGADTHIAGAMGEGVEVLFQLVSGNEEQKVSAAGALGYLKPDSATKKTVAANGGIALLLKFIQDSTNDGDTGEALTALRGLCSDRDDVMRASLEAANRVAILSKLAQSGNAVHRELVSAVLSDAMDSVRNV